MMSKFFHSVGLDLDKCNGCINCLKRCPTEAIRIKKGKSDIKPEHCIDCAECIRVCPMRAKKADCDPLSAMDNYAYKIALPHPALYAQFNNLEDKSLVLDALRAYGFDDVFEVATASEMVSEMTRGIIREGGAKLPVISSSCPSVVRLIRVRFPNLIPYISPLNSPEDIAADLALRDAVSQTSLLREKIGICFITPCPAKVTAVRAPLGRVKSEIDKVIAISDIYPKLLPLMKSISASGADTAGAAHNRAGRIGVSWGGTGGEAGGVLSDKCLSADGIENVIKVLSDLEDERFLNLEFIELNACPGGCVGGVLGVENPYIARVKLNALRKYLPVSGTHLDGEEPEFLFRDKEVEYLPVYKLGQNVGESIKIMIELKKIAEKLPGLDCGCCGAPTCRAFAEDVATGNSDGRQCIHGVKV